jgi:hypothetical protein
MKTEVIRYKISNSSRSSSQGAVSAFVGRADTKAHFRPPPNRPKAATTSSPGKQRASGHAAQPRASVQPIGGSTKKPPERLKYADVLNFQPTVSDINRLRREWEDVWTEVLRAQDVRKAADHVCSRANEALHRGKFAWVDGLLHAAIPHDVPAPVIIALVMTTAGAASKLPGRTTLLENARRHLRGQVAPKVMALLERLK